MVLKFIKATTNIDPLYSLKVGQVINYFKLLFNFCGCNDYFRENYKSDTNYVLLLFYSFDSI